MEQPLPHYIANSPHRGSSPWTKNQTCHDHRGDAITTTAAVDNEIVSPAVILIAADATKEPNNTCLEWALTNVVHPGDRVVFLGIIHRIVGYKSQASQSEFGGVSKHALEAEICKKLDLFEKTIQTLSDLYDKKGVYLDITITAGSPLKTVLLREAVKLRATHVILDRNLRKDKHYYREQLDCAVAIFSQDNQVKYVRGTFHLHHMCDLSGPNEKVKTTARAVGATIYTINSDSIPCSEHSTLPEEGSATLEYLLSNKDYQKSSDSVKVRMDNRETTCPPSKARGRGGHDADDVRHEFVGGGDIISKCKLLNSDECPRIPLCRLIPYARVRGLRNDVTELKSAFQYEGYLPEKGDFIVSVCTGSGEETEVTSSIRQSWSPMWREIDDLFERELELRDNLHYLSRKMFYVWDGNHRTTAWMSVIAELYRETKARHIRIMCTVIDPRKISEISLLASLQQMNLLNEHAVIKPSLRDVLINANNICECDAQAFMSSLTPQECGVIESARSREVKGIAGWYPLSRGYLSRLIFQVDYSNDVKKAIERVQATIPVEEQAAAAKKEIDAIQRRISDRMGQVLDCLDPQLGDAWKSKLFSLNFENAENVITLEKIRCIALAPLKVEKRLEYLSLLEASSVMRNIYHMPSGDISYRGWLAQEISLEKVENHAITVLAELKMLASMEQLLELPADYTLHQYYEDIKLEGRKNMFTSLKIREPSELKTVGKGEFASAVTAELDQAARRVVFRYLRYLKNEKKIDKLPPHCKGWTDISKPTTSMYPVSMQGHSQWELANCPWWLDFSGGQVLTREHDLYARYFSGKKKGELLKSQVTSSRPNTREKEWEECSQDVEQPRPPPMDFAPDVQNESDATKNIAKVVTHFIYYSLPSSNRTMGHGGSTVYGCSMGDYILMGQDFAHGKKNDMYAKIHDFFLLARDPCREYTKKGKSVKWAADFIFLDFPTGGELDIGDGLPPWNLLSEDHVRHGIATAASSLADSGWLAMLFPITGPCLTWVEKYVRIQDLDVARRVVVLDKSEYGYTRHYEENMPLRTSMLVFACHNGATPPVFMAESRLFFDIHRVRATDDMWTHYIPKARRTQAHSSTQSVRGGLERSTGFVSMLLSLLCVPGGLVLEMGCGTGPLMKSCQATARSCYSFDMDPLIVDTFVLPLVQARSCQDEKDIGDDGYSTNPTTNPFDD